jgi:nicotinamide-nucleotide amidase
MELATDDKFVESLWPSREDLRDERLFDVTVSFVTCLREKKMQFAAAESCSGGWIAKLITDVSGSSEVFQGSLVTYSNTAKHKLLGVMQDSLETHGAVSREVVLEMAAGVLQVLPVDCSVAVSGIAGPDGGNDEKPVGTVWLCWRIEGQSVTCRFVFEGDRELIRRATCYCALEGLRRLLIDY